MRSRARRESQQHPLPEASSSVGSSGGHEVRRRCVTGLFAAAANPHGLCCGMIFSRERGSCEPFQQFCVSNSILSGDSFYSPS